MATIRLHLIGFSKEYIFKLEKHNFTFIDILSHLLKKGLTMNELKEIRFVHNGEQFNDNEFKIYESNGLIFSINLYTHSKIVLTELIGKIFKRHNESSSSDEEDEDEDDERYPGFWKTKPESKAPSDTMKYIVSEPPRESLRESPCEYIIPLKKEPLPDKDETDDELTPDELDKINHEIVSDLKDPDFIKLLQICINKPDYLDKVARYITNGTMVDKICDIDKIEFDDNFNGEYDKLSVILSSLDIIIDEELVKSIITYFEGNINLSLRYIISIN